MSEPDMKLPEGKTCGDCIHFQRCKVMVGATRIDTVCDWSPSRFHERQPLVVEKVETPPLNLTAVDNREQLALIDRDLTLYGHGYGRRHPDGRLEHLPAAEVIVWHQGPAMEKKPYG